MRGKWSRKYVHAVIFVITMLVAALVAITGESTAQTSSGASAPSFHNFSPAPESAVPMCTPFSFHTSFSVNYPSERPILFLMDPGGQWWPWMNVVPANSARTQWKLNVVRFGATPSTGSLFMVKIIVIPNASLVSGITIAGQRNPLFISAGSPIPAQMFFQVTRQFQRASQNIQYSTNGSTGNCP